MVRLVYRSTRTIVDVLDVDGVADAYHSGGDGQPFYCPAGRARQPIVDPRV